MFSEEIVFRAPNSAKNTELVLWFSSRPDITLERVLFRAITLPGQVLAVRGKSPGAYSGAQTFQWYLGPQALMVFLLRAASRAYPSSLPILDGGSGSIAASLDMIIEKSSSWIYD